MRAMAPSASIGTLLLGLVLQVCPQGKSEDATRTGLGQSQSQSKPAQGIYAADPDHIWNRLFRLFYVRHTRDGREYGGDELDPYLWPETKYLLRGSFHDEALKSLDEFLQQHSERLIADPLKRALFQRDFWQSATGCRCLSTNKYSLAQNCRSGLLRSSADWR
jgi:hypothetical protein